MAATKATVSEKAAALLASVVETLQHKKDAYTADLAAIRLPDTKNERAYYRALDRRREIERDITSLDQAIAHIKTYNNLFYMYDPLGLFGKSLQSVSSVASGAHGSVDIVKQGPTLYYRKIVKAPITSFAACLQELDMNRFVTARIPLHVSNLCAGTVRIVPTTTSVHFEQLFAFLPGSDIVTFSETRRITHVDAARIYCMAMEAIEALHAIGIVHRDIKPDNLFLETGADGAPVRVRLIDFGVSEHYAAHDKFLAQGTPNYSRYNLMFRDPSKNLYTGRISYQNDKDAMKLFWEDWMGKDIPRPVCTASERNAATRVAASVPLPVSPKPSMGGRRTRRQRGKYTRRRR